MTRTIVRTADAPAPAGAYSQAVVVGDVVYCAGQVGIDPSTGTAEVGVAAQTERALRNVAAVLAAAGSTLADIVTVTVFLRHASEAPTFNAAYAAAMPEPRPARSTVGVELPEPLLVEITVMAVRGSGTGGRAESTGG